MSDDVKKTLEEQNAQRQKAMAERAKAGGRPTPTQMEIDLTMLGHPPETIEPDGSPPDLGQGLPVKKELQAGSGAPYQTRHVESAQRPGSTAKRES
jgi:hypothetical protein